MHNDEMWQVYASNGEPIVGEGWEAALDNPTDIGRSDVIVGVAVVFLYRWNEAGELELLWQRRSDKVSRFPGYYDTSAGGHINLGESAVEGAIRECREEIGVEISAEDLNFCASIFFSGVRIGWVYMVDYTGCEEAFRFDDEEVSEVKWVPYKETKDFREKYAKPSVRDNDLLFMALDSWFKGRGLV